ncbi:MULTISPECIES: universal stress protein [unclassified Adlercreutzia]|uniref:universal stress protein n=1 Tax=unclassified Adlercreutzia TaxID=2636013 RepID=UPI0013EA1C73|nr:MULTISPECIES: universal stress protein [unclassified Adlercreutzia]
MWCNKILVAYDGSSPSRAAIDLALEVAKPSERIELLLVHVMRLYSAGAEAVGINGVIAEDAERVQSELQGIADVSRNPASVKLLKGTSPADLIVRCAVEEGCDLIIMGSRGKGGVKGYLGSVSYAVTKDSPVSVLVAKEAGAR